MYRKKTGNVFKYDLHVHTSQVSRCGKVSAEDMVRMYSRTDVSGIVITDHYKKHTFEKLKGAAWEQKAEFFLEGYHAAKREAKKYGIKIFLGAEITFDYNSDDYLIYGINTDIIKNCPELYMLHPERFLEFAKEHNLLVIQAHPFRHNIKREFIDIVDGIEVYNGNPRHNSNNDTAYEYAKDNNLIMTGGSDFHQPQDLNRSGIKTENRIESLSMLVDILRTGKYVLYK